jgi:hypothetical protein
LFSKSAGVRLKIFGLLTYIPPPHQVEGHMAKGMSFWIIGSVSEEYDNIIGMCNGGVLVVLIFMQCDGGPAEEQM